MSRKKKSLEFPHPVMEARTSTRMPEGKEWWYEPKWDGFRALVFRHGDHVELQSKARRRLTRYFPELVTRFGALKAKEFVMDGEIVVFDGKSLSFDQLLRRIHPAASRVLRLAAETPASFIAFDLLSEAGVDLRALPLEDRRRRLEAFSARQFSRGATSGARLFLSPGSNARRTASSAVSDGRRKAMGWAPYCSGSSMTKER